MRKLLMTLFISCFMLFGFGSSISHGQEPPKKTKTEKDDKEVKVKHKKNGVTKETTKDDDDDKTVKRKYNPDGSVKKEKVKKDD